MTEFTAAGRFDVDLAAADGLLPDTARFTVTKVWTGQVRGGSVGTMLSAGDPQAGAAGYVALERFEGTVGERSGSIVLQQSGSMLGGETTLTYAVVPGSGTGELAGLVGSVTLDLVDGVHQVTWILRDA